ncbi:hypothetical protein [Paraburkholderia caffeinilytica]|uniref:hypothetical protein n=1 Tax=Paraburkholderia caffeinilytica TaxID=1761016 RepID=UPI003DA0E0FD
MDSRSSHLFCSVTMFFFSTSRLRRDLTRMVRMYGFALTLIMQPFGAYAASVRIPALDIEVRISRPAATYLNDAGVHIVAYATYYSVKKASVRSVRTALGHAIVELPARGGLAHFDGSTLESEGAQRVVDVTVSVHAWSIRHELLSGGLGCSAIDAPLANITRKAATLRCVLTRTNSPAAVKQ